MGPSLGIDFGLKIFDTFMIRRLIHNTVIEWNWECKGRKGYDFYLSMFHNFWVQLFVSRINNLKH